MARMMTNSLLLTTVCILVLVLRTQALIRLLAGYELVASHINTSVYPSRSIIIIMSGRSQLICLPKSIVEIHHNNKQAAASDDQAAATGGGNGMTFGQILSYIHPRGGKPAQFLLSPKGDFCELQSVMPSGRAE